MNEDYLKLLITLSKKAKSKDEVPVSAIVLKNNKVISKAYNKRENSKIIYNHAEIIAITKAAKKLHTWNLSECTLLVTLKPCEMCMSIINQTKIKNVYYLLDKPESKKDYYKTKYIKLKESNETKEYSQILSDFFKKKRDK